MDDKRAMLRHFLAAIAYRTQKALRGAPASFATFRAAPQVRTPHELVGHMNSVLGYARTFFIGGEYRPALLPDFEIVPGPKLEVDEDQPTFAGNAEKKAKAYLAATGIASLADDSGLCVDALDGRPGVLSARYGKDDAERIAKLLAELGDNPRRFARFVCSLCLARPDGTLERARPRLSGTTWMSPVASTSDSRSGAW